MSIQSEIDRIKTNIENAYTNIGIKGGQIPATKNSQNLASAIMSISGGGESSVLLPNLVSDSSLRATDAYNSNFILLQCGLSNEFTGIDKAGTLQSNLAWGYPINSDDVYANEEAPFDKGAVLEMYYNASYKTLDGQHSWNIQSGTSRNRNIHLKDNPLSQTISLLNMNRIGGVLYTGYLTRVTIHYSLIHTNIDKDGNPLTELNGVGNYRLVMFNNSIIYS